ncbi:MAG: glycosyltransferase [Chitinophagaceae bacterium]|nr:MAG: glycosyltransferase [Chitinophagaceae bacterium]
MPAQKKILFILPYPVGHAPSQRFRVEAFFPLLEQHQITFSTHSFLSVKAWNILYKKGSFLQKISAVLKGYVSRYYVLFFKAWRYEYVFIHREAAPLGPPVFEWLLAKIFRKKYILDYDDAIWIPNTSEENRLVSWVKAFWKVKYTCKWAYKVVGGNDYLCEYARRYNSKVIKIPTCVDTIRRHNTLKTAKNTGKRIIGWTGSHSTLHYLEQLLPALVELQQDHPFEFLVISNKAPQLPLADWRFIPWNEQSEVTDLLQMDIGVMPLKSDAWSEGKCGFKLIQYLSLGIPAVASDVGVNNQIIQNGVSGYLATDSQEWVAALKSLLLDEALRERMGKAGRAKVLEEYSIQSASNKFLSLFAK